MWDILVNDTLNKKDSVTTASWTGYRVSYLGGRGLGLGRGLDGTERGRDVTFQLLLQLLLFQLFPLGLASQPGEEVSAVTHTHSHTHTHTPSHTHTLTHIYAYSYTLSNTHSHSYKYTCITFAVSDCSHYIAVTKLQWNPFIVDTLGTS